MGLAPSRLGDVGCADIGETAAFVYSYQVPGSAGDLQSVRVSTANDRTPQAADTVLAVYRGPCSTVANPLCNDDVDPGRDTRSEVLLSVPAGSLLTIVAGYYGDTADSVPAHLRITSRSNAPPVLESATARRLGGRVEVHVVARDPDGSDDLASAELAFRDVDGASLPIADTNSTLSRPAFSGVLRLTTRGSELVGVVPTTIDLSRATAVSVRVGDSSGAFSTTSITAPIVDVTEVALGQTCNDTDVFCYSDLFCTSGRCAASSALDRLCGAANAIVLGAGEERVITNAVPNGPNVASPVGEQNCLGSVASASELAYRVRVPDGHDLVAETRGDDIDTVVHARTSCTDPGTSVACSDDISASDRHSRIVVESPSSPVSVFVETYRGTDNGLDFEVRFFARPVRAPGARCDATGEADRCANAPCTADGRCP